MRFSEWLTWALAGLWMLIGTGLAIYLIYANLWLDTLHGAEFWLYVGACGGATAMGMSLLDSLSRSLDKRLAELKGEGR